MNKPRLHNGKPCRVDEMQVGTTLFTVISVQSDSAKEAVNDKVKNLILNNRENSTKLCVGYSQ
ncbi:hypothetical protein [Allobaculum stercoricanis]|uniref:hypothetical protein n=1 Tax=Allobaculum stercoricanis TaxID=174709 RepID=UPI0023EFC067|nr:hypothetical protein [Allobaculum stercoricanis]